MTKLLATGKMMDLKAVKQLNCSKLRETFMQKRAEYRHNLNIRLTFVWF